MLVWLWYFYKLNFCKICYSLVFPVYQEATTLRDAEWSSEIQAMLHGQTRAKLAFFADLYSYPVSRVCSEIFPTIPQQELLSSSVVYLPQFGVKIFLILMK
jgi:hypothetical protein